MPILLLTEEDVRQILTMDLALEAVEEGLRKYALDEGQNVPRARVQTDHAMLHVMSASAKTLGYLGTKLYITGKKGSFFHVALYDSKAGTLTSSNAAAMVSSSASNGTPACGLRAADAPSSMLLSPTDDDGSPRTQRRDADSRCPRAPAIACATMSST